MYSGFSFFEYETRCIRELLDWKYDNLSVPSNHLWLNALLHVLGTDGNALVP